MKRVRRCSISGQVYAGGLNPQPPHRVRRHPGRMPPPLVHQPLPAPQGPQRKVACARSMHYPPRTGSQTRPPAAGPMSARSRRSAGTPPPASACRVQPVMNAPYTPLPQTGMHNPSAAITALFRRAAAKLTARARRCRRHCRRLQAARASRPPPTSKANSRLDYSQLVWALPPGSANRRHIIGRDR